MDEQPDEPETESKRDPLVSNMVDVLLLAALGVVLAWGGMALANHAGWVPGFHPSSHVQDAGGD